MADKSCDPVDVIDLTVDSDVEDWTVLPSVGEDPLEDCTVIRVYSLMKEDIAQNIEPKEITMSLNEADFKNLFDHSSSEEEEACPTLVSENSRQDFYARSLEQVPVRSKVKQYYFEKQIEEIKVRPRVREDYLERSLDDVQVTTKMGKDKEISSIYSCHKMEGYLDEQDSSVFTVSDTSSPATSGHQEQAPATIGQSVFTNVTEIATHDLLSCRPEEGSETYPSTGTLAKSVFARRLDLGIIEGQSLDRADEDSIKMGVSDAMSQIFDSLDSDVKGHEQNTSDANSLGINSNQHLSGEINLGEKSLRTENEQTPRHDLSNSRDKEDRETGSSLRTIIGCLVEEARKLPVQDFASCNVSGFRKQKVKRRLFCAEKRRRETRGQSALKSDTRDLSELFDFVIQKYRNLNEEGKLFDSEVVLKKERRGRRKKDRLLKIKSIQTTGEMCKAEREDEGIPGFPNGDRCLDLTPKRKRRGRKKKKDENNAMTMKPAGNHVTTPCSNNHIPTIRSSGKKRRAHFTEDQENGLLTRKRKCICKREKNSGENSSSSLSLSPGLTGNVQGIVLQSVSVSVCILGQDNPYVDLCGRCKQQEHTFCENKLKQKMTIKQRVDHQISSQFSWRCQEKHPGRSERETNERVNEILRTSESRRTLEEEGLSDCKYSKSLLPGDIYIKSTIKDHKVPSQSGPNKLNCPYNLSRTKPFSKNSELDNQDVAIMRPILLQGQARPSAATNLSIKPSALDLSRPNQSRNLHQPAIDHGDAVKYPKQQARVGRSRLSCFSTIQQSASETNSDESSDLITNHYYSESEEMSFSAYGLNPNSKVMDLSTNRRNEPSVISGNRLPLKYLLTNMNQEYRQAIDPFEDRACDEDFQADSSHHYSTSLPSPDKKCENLTNNCDTFAAKICCDSKSFEISSRNLDSEDPTPKYKIQTSEVLDSYDLASFSMNYTNLPDRQDNDHCPPDNHFTACLAQPAARISSPYEDVYEKQFLHQRKTCLPDLDLQAHEFWYSTDSHFDRRHYDESTKVVLDACNQSTIVNHCSSQLVPAALHTSFNQAVTTNTKLDYCSLPESPLLSTFDAQSYHSNISRQTTQDDIHEELKPIYPPLCYPNVSRQTALSDSYLDFELIDQQTKPMVEHFTRHSSYHPFSLNAPRANLEGSVDSTCNWKSEGSPVDDESTTETCSECESLSQHFPTHFQDDRMVAQDESVLSSERLGQKIQDLSTGNKGFVQPYEYENDSSMMTLDESPEANDYSFHDVDPRNKYNPKNVTSLNLNSHHEQETVCDAEGRAGVSSCSKAPLGLPSLEHSQYDSGFESHNTESDAKVRTIKWQIPATHLPDGDKSVPISYPNVSSVVKNNHYPPLVTELNSSSEAQLYCFPTVPDHNSSSQDGITHDETDMLLTHLGEVSRDFYDICSDISDKSLNLGMSDLSSEMGSSVGSPGLNGSPKPSAEEQSSDFKSPSLVEASAKDQGQGSEQEDSVLFLMADSISSIFSDGKQNGILVPPPPECDVVEVKASQGQADTGDKNSYWKDGKTIISSGIEGSASFHHCKISPDKLKTSTAKMNVVPQCMSRWSSEVFCEKCEFTCVVLENLFIHYWTCHRLEQMILCPSCRSVFIYLDVYKKHVVTCQEQ